jgi:hypothetical protein
MLRRDFNVQDELAEVEKDIAESNQEMLKLSGLQSLAQQRQSTSSSSVVAAKRELDEIDARKQQYVDRIAQNKASMKIAEASAAQRQQELHQASLDHLPGRMLPSG